MNITLNFKKQIASKSYANSILFVDEKFNISGLKKYLSNSEYSYISDLIKTKDIKKKIVTFDISSKKKIILVSLKKNLKSFDAENLGAKCYDIFKEIKITGCTVNSDTIPKGLKNITGYFLHGIKLKSYKFEKYKTTKNKGNISIDVVVKTFQIIKIKLSLVQ